MNQFTNRNRIPPSESPRRTFEPDINFRPGQKAPNFGITTFNQPVTRFSQTAQSRPASQSLPFEKFSNQRLLTPNNSLDKNEYLIHGKSQSSQQIVPQTRFPPPSQNQNRYTHISNETNRFSNATLATSDLSQIDHTANSNNRNISHFHAGHQYPVLSDGTNQQSVIGTQRLSQSGLPQYNNQQYVQSGTIISAQRLAQPSLPHQNNSQRFPNTETSTQFPNNLAAIQRPPNLLTYQNTIGNTQQRHEINLAGPRFQHPNIHCPPPTLPTPRFQPGPLTRQNNITSLPHQSEFLVCQQTNLNLDRCKRELVTPDPDLYLSNDAAFGGESSSRGKEQDKQWLEHWISKRISTVHSKQSPASITISVAQEKYGKLLELMNKLEQQVGEADNITSGDEETWQNEAHEMENTAYEIEKLKQELTDEMVVKELTRKIELRRKKRERLKRRQKELYDEEQETERRQEIKHQKIDEWRRAIAQKVIEEKQEKELKALADQMLSEIRKKIADVTKTFDRIKGLQNLRKLRKERAERQDVYTSPSMDQLFDKHIERLTELVSPRLVIYDAEMKTLMVMLETEHEETMEKEREKSKLLRLQKEESEQQRIDDMLFGEEDPLDSLDPLLPFRNFYDQANFNFEAFLQIRGGWDSFTVPSGSAQSSRIPDGWVIPEEASSDVWASALKDN